jgi:hypothetical protein
MLVATSQERAGHPQPHSARLFPRLAWRGRSTRNIFVVEGRAETERCCADQLDL